MKKVKGYIFSRSFLKERVPQHVQNIVIRDFCKRENLDFSLSVTEYSMKKSNYILNNLVSELKSINGIVAYSIFQMPHDNLERNKIFQKIIKLKKIIYFANEGMKISNKSEVERVESIWLVKKFLSKCLNIKDYGKIKKFRF